MTFFDFGQVIDFESKFVIFGIPWDYLTSIKAPNSAIAPRKIREVTKNLALTTEMGYEIPELDAVDLGNVKIDTPKVDKNLKEIQKFVKQIFSQKNEIIPVMIGGDHFCSFPVIKAIGEHFKKKEELGYLIFDAHLDFYEQWDKGVYSHATTSHRIYDLDFVNKNNILIAGTRDIDIPEKQNADQENITFLNAFKLQDYGLNSYIEEIIDFFKRSKIKYLYISIDIDVLDPSIAPATGYAIPGGLSYRELWKTLREITREFKVIGFDLVEVAPNLDLPNNLTSNLAAKLIIELISFISNNIYF
ncbi:MAG: arginase family protein [Promethearchaeota archaeon]